MVLFVNHVTFVLNDTTLYNTWNMILESILIKSCTQKARQKKPIKPKITLIG